MSEPILTKVLPEEYIKVSAEQITEKLSAGEITWLESEILMNQVAGLSSSRYTEKLLLEIGELVESLLAESRERAARKKKKRKKKK
jgi:predicted nucleic-acid-binding protein